MTDNSGFVLLVIFVGVCLTPFMMGMLGDLWPSAEQRQRQEAKVKARDQALDRKIADAERENRRLDREFERLRR